MGDGGGEGAREALSSVRALYNAVLIGGGAVTLPFWAVRAATLPKWRAGLPQRLTGIGEGGSDPGARPIWVHAVSAGEAAAAKPIVDLLRAERPGWPVFFTTVTQTGQTVARERLFPDLPVAYFPLDLPWAVGRSLSSVRPRAFVSLEKEIWPNFFWELAVRGIPSAIVNGRLTESSYRRNRRVLFLFRRVLPSISLFAMQAEGDAERMIALGAPAERVHVTGNTKVDQVPSRVDASVVDALRADLAVPAGTPVFVAGSTHKGEERAAALCHKELARSVEGAVTIVVPRHLERLPAIEAELSELGLAWQRRTRVAGRREAGIVLLDTMGELQSVYAIADVAFVGGTLAPIGGHNPLEPAALGVPVLVGPHTDKCAEAVDMLMQAGGLVAVADEGALCRALLAWMADADARGVAGRAAQGAVEGGRGATRKTVELLLPLVEKGDG